MNASALRVMPPTTQARWLEPALVASIHELWDALADFPASRTDDALQHLLSSLCGLFQASSACWMGATQGDAGWRVHAQRRNGFAIEVAKARDPDLSMVRHLEQAGTSFRAQRWADFVEPEWFESDYFHAHYGRSTRDAIYVGFPLSGTAESMFTVLRGVDQPAFSAEERDGIGYALRGIKRFHRHALLSFGLVEASAKLTNTERKVLQQLLTGRTEKEVAAELALSYHTTHAHVASILRKFGVGNRPSLMALWLR